LWPITYAGSSSWQDAGFWFRKRRLESFPGSSTSFSSSSNFGSSDLRGSVHRGCEHTFVDDETKQRIRGLLKAGRLRRDIAKEVGVSPSTVTRWARLLGFPDKTARSSIGDWAAIQSYYDAGHTIDECRTRFDFTYGAWDKAVTRGEIIPRPRSRRELSHATRDEVEHLLASGLTQAQIARELDLTKSTVAYHARALGVRADPRYARRHDWPAVQLAIDEEGLSMKQCLDRFGFCGDTWARAVQRGDIVPRPHVLSLEQELLVVGRKTSRSHLKQRLLRDGIKKNHCERCGISEWQGKPLNMQLHHLNGDGLDNRLSNLELLCANCHSQTSTYGGRNGHRRKAPAAGSEAA
jgi:5-methylcytosine-specific restriction endonuclease McrA